MHEKVKAIDHGILICFLFRPPYGDYDNEVITGVLSCGYYPVDSVVY
ncbi:MAG: hypothetical protein ACLUD0_20935 [Eubacterium ramulus]